MMQSIIIKKYCKLLKHSLNTLWKTFILGHDFHNLAKTWRSINGVQQKLNT